MIRSGGVAALAPPVAPLDRHGPWLIFAVAALILLPEWIAGPSYTDSFRYNHVWGEQFSRLFLAGDPWPRWLPASWDGLGSPTFHFYPPFYFWVLSAVRAASFGTLSAGASGTIASALILAASGLAMRAWLRPLAGERVALIAALAYMAAPYHLYDIYVRGAVAEASAYALLPLVMIAVRQIADGRMAGLPILATSYAALLLAHLPAALLASVSVIPAFMLWAARGRIVRILPVYAGGIAVGLCLAAPYWWPALALRHAVSTQAMGGEFFSPDRWFFFSAGAWPRLALQITMTSAAMLIALATIRQARAGWLWGGIVIICALLIAGAVPAVWSLPGLREVQFPWRLLLVVEFAAITLVAIHRPRLRDPLLLAGLAVLGVAGGLTAVVGARMVETGWREGDYARGVIDADMAEAPEYLPAGYPIPLDHQKRADPGQFVAPVMPPAIADDTAARLRWRAEGDGSLRLWIESPAATTITARRFAFPGWVATGEGRIVTTRAAGPDRLVSWDVPAGSHSYSLHRIATAPEKTGWGIGAIGLCGLLVSGAASLRWRRLKTC